MKRKTIAPGVRVKEHPTRKHGVRKDVYYSIYYRIDTGKRDEKGRKITAIKEEGLGWASEKWTLQKALSELARLKEAQRLGEKGQTLAERRAIEQERRQEEERQAELERQNTFPFDKFFTETYLPITKTKSKRSQNRENQLYKLWVKPVMGPLPFKQIGEIQLERIRKNMMDAGRANASINYAWAFIRQVFNVARDRVSMRAKTR